MSELTEPAYGNRQKTVDYPTNYQNERENLGFESGDDSEYNILPRTYNLVAYSVLL